MKTFAIPAAINGVTFQAYVQWLLDNDLRADPRDPAMRNNSRSAVRIEGEIIRATDTATSVSLTTYDWNRLKVLLATPDLSARSRSEGEPAATTAARTLVLGAADAPFITAVNNAV